MLPLKAHTESNGTQHIFEKVNTKLYNKGVIQMSKSELVLVRMLAEKIGIKTVAQLEEFKTRTGVTTNDMLIRRLALYVAADRTFAEVVDHKPIYY